MTTASPEDSVNAECDVSFSVLIFADAYLPGAKGGGPIRSLQEIMERMPPAVTLLMVTADRDLGDRHPYAGLSSRVIGHGQHRVFYWNARSAHSWWFLFRILRARPYDLLYVNSLWSPLFTMLPISLPHGIIRAKRVLIAPRGELSPGALGLKRVKKRLALATWGHIVAAKSPLWHASTDLERTHILTHFPGADVLLQSDSIGPAPTPTEPCHAAARFVFISRISPMKNLLFLLRALSNCREQLTLDIFGPLEDQRYWEKCEEAIKRLPANVTVQYRGELAMDRVQATFARYDAFLFPTLGENFGHVVPESLAAGCPVVCSTDTPWTDLLERGCGAALDIVDPAHWTREIDVRAGQSVAERTTNKRRATHLYALWRDKQEYITAVQVALARGQQ